MRLGILDHGHRARARLFLRLIRWVTRHPVDPVVQLALCRPGYPQSARAELLAVLPLLERVTHSPAQITAADIGAVRAAGVPDEAIVDALHVNFIFYCINRLANAFGSGWESGQQVRLGAKVIHRTSCRLPRILMRWGEIPRTQITAIADGSAGVARTPGTSATAAWRGGCPPAVSAPDGCGMILIERRVPPR